MSFYQNDSDNRVASFLDLLLWIFGIVFLIAFIRWMFTRTGAIVVGSFLLVVLVLATLSRSPSNASDPAQAVLENIESESKPKAKSAKRIQPVVTPVSIDTIVTDAGTILSLPDSATTETQSTRDTITVSQNNINTDTVTRTKKRGLFNRLFGKKQKN